MRTFSNQKAAKLLRPWLGAVLLSVPMLGHGGTVVFNGSNQFVQAPDSPSLHLSTNLTIEAWVKFRQVTRTTGGYDWQCVVAKPAYSSSYGLMAYAPGTASGVLRFYHSGTANPTTDMPWRDAEPNRWYHLAATFGNGRTVIYLDGVPKATNAAATGAITVNTSQFNIGESSSGPYPFDGQMDEVRLWNVTRTTEQIQADMRRNLTGAEPGLVALYRFDETTGTMAYDSSTNGNNTRLYNGPLWSLGPGPVSGAAPVFSEPPVEIGVGSARLSALVVSNSTPISSRFEYGPESPCLTLDGSGQYVHVSGFGTNAPTTEITIEFWQKVDAQRPQVTLVLNPDNSANRINAHVPWSDGNVYWDFGNVSGAGRLYYQPPVPITGTWQHFALVASQAGNYMRIYRNGILEAQKAGMTPLVRGNYDLLIGGPSGYRFGGQLDELRVWQVARSPEEIQANMCRSLTGSETNLVSYWKFDEGRGVIAHDSAPSARDGFLVTVPTYPIWATANRPSYGASIPAAELSSAGSALALNGLNEYALLPSATWFDGDFTVEAWVYPHSYGTWSRVIDFGNGAGSDNVLLAVSSGTSGLVYGQIWKGGSVVGNISATQPVPVNEWSHVAWSLAGNTMTLYVNGAVAAVSTASAQPNRVTRNFNYIGRSNWSADSYANASFDELRIWKVARSRAEILAGMRQGPANDAPGLRGWWRFDEAVTTSAVDASTNHVDAILYGGQHVPLARAEATVDSLAESATYHYRAVSVDTNGVTVFGPDQCFTTLDAAAGGALAMDGVNDFVRVGASVIPSSGDFTVEAWANLPALPDPFNYREIVSQGSSGNAFYMGFYHGDRCIRAGDGWGTTGVRFPIGSWTHIAVVKSGNNALLYTNGVLAASKNGAIPNPAASGFFDIGRQYGNYGEFWPGQIDEVRVWSTARDATQILLNFNRRLSGSEPGLVGLYHFDEGGGNVAIDSSLSQNHGVLYGGVTRTASGATLGLPAATTLAASGLAEDRATLNGAVVTDGTPTTAWFEWGTNQLLSPVTDNVGVYFVLGSGPTSFAGVDYQANPTTVRPFTTMDFVSQGWSGGPTTTPFAIRDNATLYIARDGMYTFYLSSDDGSRLWIDSNLIVDNDGSHAVLTRSGSVFLSAGPHYIETFYFQSGGAGSLSVLYSGPGIGLQNIPFSAFQEPLPQLVSNSVGASVLTATQAVSLNLSNLWPGTHYYRLVSANANGTNYGRVQSFEVLNPYSLTALSFDGFSDYVITPNLRSFYTNETVTLEAWFNANAPGVIIDERGQPGDGWRDSQIEIVPVATNASLGEVRVRMWALATNILGQVSFGTWNHVALRYNKATLKAEGFLNGVKYSPAAAGDRLAPWEYNAGLGLYYGIGLGDSQHLGSGAYFNGLIDEVRIWSVARSDQEITNNYARRLGGNEPGLVAYYRFDDRAGATALDSSLNGNNATLYTSVSVVATPGNGPTWIPANELANYPLANTLPAVPVQAKSATLRGMVNPSTLPTSARFEWGTTTNYGNVTGSQSVGSGISFLPYSTMITGLDPGVTYHYRIWAGNAVGSVVGEDQTFTTLAVGVGWPVATRMSQGGMAQYPRHALDAAGNVYLAGLFSGLGAFGGTTLYPEGGSSRHSFIGKLTASGNWAWATNVFSRSNSWARINSLVVDRANNTWVVGQCAGTNGFGDFTLTSGANSTNGFIARLDSSGRWVWAAGFGGAGVSSANAVAVGTNGNIFAAGQFSGANVMFGTNAASSMGGSDIFVAKLAESGEWLWVKAAGSAADNEAALAIAADAQENIVLAGRFGGSGVFDLAAQGPSDLFVASFDSTGLKQASKRGGGSGADGATSLALDKQGNIYVLGQFVGQATYDASQLPSSPGTNIFVMRLDAALNMKWFALGPGVKADSLAVDSTRKLVYVTGEYEQTVQFGPAITLSSAGASDLFIAELPMEVLGSQGRWLKVQSLGDIGIEGRGSVAVDFSGDVLVSGSFQNSLELGYVSLSVLETQDILVARLDPEFRYEHNTWTIGQPIPVPVEAQDTNNLPLGQPTWVILEKDQPDANELNSLVWAEGGRQLFAVRPVTALVRWPTSADATNAARVINAVGDCRWPARPQVHIAGAPVEIDPQGVGFRYKYLDQKFTSAAGSVDSSSMIFNASGPGYTVLQFLQTDGHPLDPLAQSSVFEVVQTMAWDDADYLRSESVEIGTTISRASHNDPTGKNGYVLFANALYDGTGALKAYDRTTRTGPIIPVNKIGPATNDELVVVWYHTNETTGIAWADQPVQYQANWPQNPDKIIIASQLGYGPIDPVSYPAAQVYNQPDPTQAGFNPNEEHALLMGGTLYALRDDLNAVVRASAPYVLLKYRSPFNNQWTMKVVAVQAEDEIYKFQYSGIAGEEIAPPKPMSLMRLCAESAGVSGPYYEDYNGRLYARAAGPQENAATVVIRWFYPLRDEFYYQLTRRGSNDLPVGASVPWMDRRSGGTPGIAMDVPYRITWPQVEHLEVGENLMNPKLGLPGIRDFASAAVIYDQANLWDTNAANSLVRLYDPLSERTLQLRLTGETNFLMSGGYDVYRVSPAFNLIEGLNTVNVRGKLVFVDLPYSIRSRLLYDPLNKNLSFSGLLDESADYGGPDNPLLLVNVMTERERDRIKALNPATEFQHVIDALFNLTRNPNRLDLNRDGQPDRAWLVGLAYEYVTNQVGNSYVVVTNIVHERLDDRPKILSAAPGTGSGYVSLVQNDDRRLAGLPVSLTVLRVEDGPYRGDLKVLLPDNVFDEKLTLRHSADFGGVPEGLEFEWYYHPATDTSVRTNLPFTVNGALDLNGWTLLDRGMGLNDITIGDGTTSSLLTLSDNYFVCRYRGYAINGQTNWSDWVGVIGGGQAQLAPGWIKRVILGLNPFESRSKNFHDSPTATYASMIQQAGGRYEGDIAFNPSADNLNGIGLISAYETVLRRGRRLSIDSAEQINDPAANSALLLAAGRVADFYMLLGNEAFADAADPTIGFRTDQAGYGTLAPCIFTFQNQLDSLLEEELCLLRGRDDSGATVKAPPVYNRLFWNFTKSDGEVAYSQTYNISDQNGDGVVNAEDARTMYPQGHGDAWGHYLTATKTYYSLLRSPNYTWLPRAEDILLAGVPVQVSYLDERKFANASAAKARTGAEIVDLTYRSKYVDDPAGQYQGYKDTTPERGWGLSEWARRAGQGAYFDWATATAILPANDPDPGHTGIQKIDRTTVQELGQIIAAYNTVQNQLDKADSGLNPLGLAKNVVPFDIDPNLISSGETHFEQIYDRALDLMGNAVTIFNHANQLSQSLRALQDTVDNFANNGEQQERDFKNRLIEIFGYPYAGDIGPGGTYPSGYDGPDLYHYMYVNTVELNGDTAPPSQTFTGFYTAIQQIDHSRPGTTFDFIFGKKDFFFPTDVPTDPGDRFTNDVLQVSYPFAPSAFGFAAPAGWGQRRAPGEIQLALSATVQAHARLKRAQINYDNLLEKIQDQLDLLQARYNVAQEIVRIRDRETKQSMGIKTALLGCKLTKRILESAISKAEKITDFTIEAIPKSVGLSADAFSGLRGTIKATAATASFGLKAGSVAAEAAAEGLEATQAQLEKQGAREIEAEGFEYEITQQFKVLEDLLRQEAALRVESFEMAQALEQCSGRYQAAVAKGLRLAEDRAAFRARMAAQTQENRYRDMTFRIFRNDAIQKYRAQFDLAAQYVFLAAVAYDFETQLLGGDNGAGREFLTDIIRQRSLGQMENGVPMAGRHGLADPLARLGQNFAVLKGQMGFNNPQTETGRFSLRNELFRLGTNAPAEWQAELKKHIVQNVWDIPEFRRYCRPFAPESAGAQPALVIRFPTTVTFGLNYFGWPLGGGDSAYDSSLFATKVRSVGVWFKDYNGSGLSMTPRVYLVPVGADVLRSPSGNNLETREWRVVDQKIPVPFPVGASSLQDPAWIPANNSLSDTLAEIRRFSSFRAYHDSGVFTPAEVISDSRLIGRSVWNTEWMLIIPGGTFLFDPNQGLDTFIQSVSDIKIFFQTYAYSGN